jgi:hypothetical protein
VGVGGHAYHVGLLFPLLLLELEDLEVLVLELVDCVPVAGFAAALFGVTTAPPALHRSAYHFWVLALSSGEQVPSQTPVVWPALKVTMYCD